VLPVFKKGYPLLKVVGGIGKYHPSVMLLALCHLSAFSWLSS